MLLAFPVPALLLVALYFLMKGLTERREVSPFSASLSLFALCFFGLGVSLYPHIAPKNVTIWDAAAPDNSLTFLLVGAVVLVPVILAYTAFSYWAFRGKVNSTKGYH